MNYSILSRNLIIKIFLVLFLICGSIPAQTEQDSTQGVQQPDSIFVMTKSAWGAVLRSAVLPGLGQIYNESYWKVPIVWGFLGYYASIWIDQDKLYNKYRDLYIESSYQNAKYKSYRDAYRNQRDEFAVYFGLAYFLNLVDAYVDAHLFDFDVSADLLTRLPQLNIRIPLN